MRTVPHRARTHFFFAVLGFAILAGGPALLAAEPETAAESAGKKYTATAYLLVERHEPHILPQAAEKDDPADFEIYRATQMQLVKSRYVLIAALRDPKVRKQPSVQREEERHHAVAWLEKQIRVKCPDQRSGVLTVSLTSSDPNEAAVLVNAVVAAYMNEVVDIDRQRRRERLSDLEMISAEKENEVRTKREQLKRQLENIGAGDDQTTAARTQLAVTMYHEFQREFQKMRAEHRNLVGKLEEAEKALTQIRDAEIPEIEIAGLLNNNPRYRDLQSRLALLELNRRRALPESNGHRTDAAAPATKQPQGPDHSQVELDAAKAQLQDLKAHTWDMVRDAKRIALKQEIIRLKTEQEISAAQLGAIEKEVEKKANEANSAGRTSIATQMERADIENIEQILRAVTIARETLRVELRAGTRVSVLGDRNAPAAVPECPD
ncbi:MAG: hypothetical protein ACLP9L_16845 [Thermoguttaceae bacterium]